MAESDDKTNPEDSANEGAEVGEDEASREASLSSGADAAEDEESSDDDASEEGGEESDDNDDASEEDDDESSDEPENTAEVQASSKPNTEASSAEDEAEYVGATRIRSKKKKKKRSVKAAQKDEGPSPGERLAAAKAAKRARKLAERGEEDTGSDLEDLATERANQASAWLDERRNVIAGIGVAALILFAGYFGWKYFAESSQAAIAIHLQASTEILHAPIEGVDIAAEDAEESEVQTYASVAARADAALEELDALIAEGPEGELLALAQLQRGRALYEKGEQEEAQAAFEAALAGNAVTREQALEGLAYTFEARGDLAEAERRFGELEGTRGEIVANYHLARLAISQDDEAGATEKLQAVLSALDEPGAPELPYTRAEAEARLMAIDASLVQRESSQDLLQQLQIQQLLQQQQQQQQP